MYPRQGNPHMQERQRKLEGLREYFPDIKEMLEGRVYDVSACAENGKTFTIRVMLSDDFPLGEGPQLQIFPGGNHLCLTPQGVVLPSVHQALGRSWSVHLNLGKFVYEVARFFAQNPPSPSSSSPSPSPSPSSFPSSLPSSSSYIQQNSSSTRSSPSIPLPPTTNFS